MMNTAQIVRKLHVLRTRPSRIADVLREPRQMVIGGTVANRLGLQVLRACKDRALWHARPARITEPVRATYHRIERDGVAVIPNFLSDEDFRLVYDEYESSRADPALAAISFGQNLMSDELLVSDFPERYPHTNRLMRDNEFLLDLAAAISRRRKTYKPHVSLFKVYKPDPDAPHHDIDYNQFAHADRHYAFVKVFFYMHDVEERNAPFCYAKGTHKLSLHRLWFEYDYSVKYARGKRDPYRYERTQTQLLADRELRDCAETLMGSSHAPCEPITGKANTLIIANNQGFHKRGTFDSPKPRVTVNLDFKYLESPAQWMYPVLKHLYTDP